ncbi:MAG: cyanophycinase, partial [Acidobacteriaceae bacterium]
MKSLRFAGIVAAACAFAVGQVQPNPNSNAKPYQYFRLGNAQAITVKTTPGFALMGGGKDLDAAFRWLCSHGQGGDFLVIRHSGDDAYNPYIQKLCKLNSVATIVLPTRAAAQDAFVSQKVREAAVIFIAGGDQAKYWNDWAGTPLQAALNEHIAQGRAIGGTSAGLAVLGGWVYTARGDQPDGPDLTSKIALADPYGEQITVDHEFLKIPLLRGILTDTHFARRDRMGRSLVFLARIEKETGKPAREIAIDERSAFALDADGTGTVLGTTAVYFIKATQPPSVLQAGKPLSMSGIEVQKARPGMH